MYNPSMPLNFPPALECQTPECANPVAVVVTRLEDGESDQTCMTCTLAFWNAVLVRFAEQNGQPVTETAPVP